jgi:hypothetical protein
MSAYDDFKTDRNKDVFVEILEILKKIEENTSK